MKQLLLFLSIIFLLFACDNGTEQNEDKCPTNSTMSSGRCVCDSGYHAENEACVISNKFIKCNDTTPDNATVILTEVEIIYSNNKWSDAANCEWTCNDGFHSEDNETCISNIKEVNCKDTHPDNSTVLIDKVEVTWNDETQWSEPAECNWNCEDDFHTEDHQTCISNTKEVDCKDVAPTNADSETIKVEVIWSTEDNSWSEPIDCNWNCSGGFHQVLQECVVDSECLENTCSGHGTCSDNGGVIECSCGAGYTGDRCNECATDFQDNNNNGECLANCSIAGLTCGDHSSCSDASGVAECLCDTDFHREGANCVSNTKEVRCNSTNKPRNATANIENVTVTWTEEDSWTAPTDCSWECDNNYHSEDTQSCVEDVKPVDCKDITPPEHAEQVTVKVDITWNDSTSSWSEPINCTWKCVGGYHFDDNDVCVVDDECLDNTCSGNGTCSDTGGIIECSCTTGYTGDRCNECATGFQDNDGNGECLVNCISANLNCSDYSSCDDSNGVAECLCDTDYHREGANCTSDTKDVVCNADSIPDNSSTTSTPNVTITWTQENGWSNPTTCPWSCTQGYQKTGETCTDLCIVNSIDCDDGTTCTTDSCKAGICSHVNVENNTICDDGSSCTLTDVCTNGTCGGTAVECNDGTCNEDDGSCSCEAGFTGDHCETNIDECASNPCIHGSCTDGINSYTCSCEDGYNGTNCDNDIDECASNPCVHGSCTDGVNSYTCTCEDGYNGTNCDNDIDECASNPCVHGSCTDGIDSFTCDCTNTGYEGDTCQININDCNPNPCLNGSSCTDGVKTYTCNCATGYEGVNCEENIDDCATNNCENGSTCVDGIASYTCDCVAGYEGTYCQIDIDECENNNCENGSTCVDGVNSYTCDCVAGYEGTYCETDIDDCASNPCVHGSCTDGVNSYTCTCEDGYDGTDCDNDIDDCASNPCLNSGVCTDGIDSFTCDCTDTGYEGDTCNTNIDECAENTDNCDLNALCTDTEGSFTCACKTGFSGDGVTCTDIDECANNDDNNCNSNATCNNIEGSFTCTCNNGYEGDGETCSMVIIINETYASTTGWVELYNKGTSSVDLSDWTVTTDANTQTIVIPDSTTIEAGGYYIVPNINIDMTIDIITLYDNNVDVFDTVEYMDLTSPDYSRIPNATGDFEDVTIATPNAENTNLVALTIDWCNTQSPSGYTEVVDTAKTIYGQVYVNGVTGVQGDDSTPTPQIAAKICWDNSGVETCKNDTFFNTGHSGDNNDEYMNDLLIPTAGTFDYYYQFSGDMGYSWTRCVDPTTDYQATILPLSDNLYISEYVEGSGDNKGIELYNGTGSEINLSQYKIWKITNGGTWTEGELALSGTLADKTTYVIVNRNADAVLLAKADVASSDSIFTFNGDDAIALVKDLNNDGSWTSDEIIDVIGQEGADPGSGWSVAGTPTATKDHTIRRKITITDGITDWTISAGSNTDDSSWIVESQDYFDNLGMR